MKHVSRRVERLACCRRLLSTQAKNGSFVDVVIVGGGVVGAAVARQLTRTVPSLSVALVEAGEGPREKLSGTPNPRSYALSPGSLDVLGLSENHERLGFYDSMQVWETGHPASLVFSSDDLDTNQSYLGAVTEDAFLLDHLWNDLASSSCQIRTSSMIDRIDCDTTNATVHLSSGQSIQCRLLVGADGARSTVREQLRIQTEGWKYRDQEALTFTVELSSPHEGRAFQRFLETGPIALLPTFSERHAIVVWSTTPELVGVYKNSPRIVDCLNEVLQRGPDQFGAGLSSSVPGPIGNLLYGMEKVVDTLHYGPAMFSQQNNTPFSMPPYIKSLASKQFSFPLSCQQAKRYTLGCCALVGDAAHTVHPMAGQGLNLGLLDAVDLVRVVKGATLAGMTPATFLGDYEISRREQVSTTISAIHALYSIFGEQRPWAKHMKSLGINAIQNIAPLRKKLIQAACEGVAY